MARARTGKSTKAEQGERMIEVKLCFWTNDIANGKGNIRPKHAWAGGVVRMERNTSHAISPGPPRPFHSLLDIGAVVERALIDHDIRLHPGRKMQKYLASSTKD